MCAADVLLPVSEYEFPAQSPELFISASRFLTSSLDIVVGPRFTVSRYTHCGSSTCFGRCEWMPASEELPLANMCSVS